MNITGMFKFFVTAKQWFAIIFLFSCSASNVSAYIAAGTNPCIAYVEAEEHSGATFNVALAVDSKPLYELQSGQYYAIPGSTKTIFSTTYSDVFRLVCTELGEPQKSFGVENIVTGGTVVQESMIIDAAEIKQATDRDSYVNVFPTSMPGVFIALSSAEGYIPNAKNTALPPVPYNYIVKSTLLVSRDFLPFSGMHTWTQINSSAVITLRDGEDGTVAPARPGFITTTISNITYQGFIEMKPTCEYSLSNSGNVDFDEVSPGEVTNNRSSTVKEKLTLNMSNCYGVYKVRTSIVQGKDTLLSGVALANNLTGDGATTGIGVSINVTAEGASENGGAVMYMDGTHPLQWTFSQGVHSAPINKNISLDVVMLRTDDVMTTGKYEATASIMLEFI